MTSISKRENPCNVVAFSETRKISDKQHNMPHLENLKEKQTKL